MKLVIDCREKDLIEQINRKIQEFNITVEVKQLLLGDIEIVDEEKKILILERKTLGDLAASIKDSRYKEQSFRLNNIEHPNHNIIYLIEGSLQQYKSTYTRIPKRTLYSAMLELNYGKGFSVFRTQNLCETAEYLLRITDKLRREKEDKGDCLGFYNGGKQTKEYCSVVKKAKKKNLTAENIGSVLLCQIPGISAKTALAIMEHYSCLYDLLNAIKQNEKCLDKITYKTKTGSQRHISKTAINNITIFLCGKKTLKVEI